MDGSVLVDYMVAANIAEKRWTRLANTVGMFLRTPSITIITRPDRSVWVRALP